MTMCQYCGYEDEHDSFCPVALSPKAHSEKFSGMDTTAALQKAVSNSEKYEALYVDALAALRKAIDKLYEVDGDEDVLLTHELFLELEFPLLRLSIERETAFINSILTRIKIPADFTTLLELSRVAMVHCKDVVEDELDLDVGPLKKWVELFLAG